MDCKKLGFVFNEEFLLKSSIFGFKEKYSGYFVIDKQKGIQGHYRNCLYNNCLFRFQQNIWDYNSYNSSFEYRSDRCVCEEMEYQRYVFQEHEYQESISCKIFPDQFSLF